MAGRAISSDGDFPVVRPVLSYLDHKSDPDGSHTGPKPGHAYLGGKHRDLGVPVLSLFLVSSTSQTNITQVYKTGKSAHLRLLLRTFENVRNSNGGGTRTDQVSTNSGT